MMNYIIYNKENVKIYLMLNEKSAIQKLYSSLSYTFLLFFRILFPTEENKIKELKEIKAEVLQVTRFKEEIDTLFRYQNKKVARALVELKSRGIQEIADYFALALLDYLKETQAENKLWRKEKVYICPVALHKSKHKKRGFNQNELILERIKYELQDLGIIYRKDILYRIKRTRDQKNLNKKERHENMKDAFASKGSPEHDSHIIVLDDIVTSGATLKEAKKAIKKSCKKCRVSLLALANA